MSRRILPALLCLICLMAAGAQAQTIRMDKGYVAYNYPDTWLVLSPELCRVYAPMIRERSMDPDALAQDMEKTHVLSCAYNTDFSQRLAVQVWEEEASQKLFDIGRAQTGDRRRIRANVEANSLWESRGYRTQDAEWQNVGERYWLYIHYTKTDNGETVGRGLRYMTVHNGQYVVLDWQNSGRRFSNRDLAQFKSWLQQMVFLQDIEEPMREIPLNVELPTETSSGNLEIVGTTEPGAEVMLSIESERTVLHTVEETTAGNRGTFRFRYSLEQEGDTELIVHAHADGLIDATARGWVTFNSKTLPVSGIEENMTTSQDQVIISGMTLAGTQLQLVTPFGLSKKRAANDGSFSFELNTKEEGSYDYTLLLEKSGYVQRRFTFTIVRIKTDDQQREEIRQTAVRIKYRDLQRGLESDLGKVLNIYGPVSEVSSGGGLNYIRMQFSKNAGGKWVNPVILTSESDPGVQAGNYISAVVAVDGVYMEQDDAGNDVSVPRLKLLFIDRVE
ncbi:MAG: hypothetical protein IJ088_06800 [Clostridia bacterium]|nr:hypothetical protein [Clostridia bacterium]